MGLKPMPNVNDQSRCVRLALLKPTKAMHKRNATVNINPDQLGEKLSGRGDSPPLPSPPATAATAGIMAAVSINA